MSADAIALPSLRDDLELIRGAPAHDGSPTWAVFDPVRNRYFRLGWLAFELVSRWQAGTVPALLERVNAETSLEVEQDDLESMLRFLYANDLTQQSASGKTDDYLNRFHASRTSLSQWLVHHYLFFRIPLFRPDKLLDATAAWIRPLFTSAFKWLVLVTGALGLYLTGRQWDSFATTFSDLFTLESAAFFAMALVIIKTLHEFGHAYTANYYGCRVTSMGVAFLVMFPVMYTDTTDAWKLTSRRARVHIAAAGMITELSIACFATLAWAVLPDGVLRSIAFFAATTAWITSLLVNINPCLRFDGYYLVADALGIENLHQRAFAFGRWRLRKLLFGGGEPMPEHMGESTRRWLVAFAWAIWVYRFFLFLGIALLVYHFFFKALGIILFVVEIAWFIALPVMREMGAWYKGRDRYFRTGRFFVTITLFTGLLVLLFVPWHDRVLFPAILELESRAEVHAVEPGVVQTLHVAAGDRVSKGDALLTLGSPPLDYETRLAQIRLDLVSERLSRAASSAEERSNLGVLNEEMARAEAALAGLQKRRERLTLSSPISGQVLHVDQSLHAGRWVNAEPTLMLVANVAEHEGAAAVYVKGLVEEREREHLMVGASAEFVPDDPQRPVLAANVRSIADTDMREFDELYLASPYGGRIAARRDTDGSLAPEASVYRVNLALTEAATVPTQVVTGMVRAAGAARSAAERLYLLVAAVLVRETGF